MKLSKYSVKELIVKIFLLKLVYGVSHSDLCEWPTVLSGLFKNLVKICLYINVVKSNKPLVQKVWF